MAASAESWLLSSPSSSNPDALTASPLPGKHQLPTSWQCIEPSPSPPPNDFSSLRTAWSIDAPTELEEDYSDYLAPHERETSVSEHKLPGVEEENGGRPAARKDRAAELWKKLMGHCSHTIQADKYLRVLCALIKTRRAYLPRTHLLPAYKELILARRVIRWEGKYSTLQELAKLELSLPERLFKIMQLMGDAVDLSAFWARKCAVGEGRCGRAAVELEQLESNFYFAECLIWMCVHFYRWAKGRGAEEEGRAKARESGLKTIKYVMDVLTSYNNSSAGRVGQINHKLAGWLTLASALIGLFLLWK
jgi:hypothetical protein